MWRAAGTGRSSVENTSVIIDPALPNTPINRVSPCHLLNPSGNGVAKALPVLDKPFGVTLSLLAWPNLSWHNLRAFPLLLTLVSWEKGSIPPVHSILCSVCRERSTPPSPRVSCFPAPGVCIPRIAFHSSFHPSYPVRIPNHCCSSPAC